MYGPDSPSWQFIIGERYFNEYTDETGVKKWLNVLNLLNIMNPKKFASTPGQSREFFYLDPLLEFKIY